MTLRLFRRPAAFAAVPPEVKMTLRSALSAVTIAGALALTACSPPPFDYVKKSRPGVLNEESSFDIEPGNPDRRAASRKLSLPGEGTLTVSADAVAQQSKLDILVFPTGAKLPIAQGSTPLIAEQLSAGDYYVVVKAMNSFPSRVRLTMSFKPKDFDAASTEDKSEEGATILVPGARQGEGPAPQEYKDSVDAVSMDRTDFYVIKLQEAGSLSVNFECKAKRGKVTAEVQPPKGGGSPEVVDTRNGWGPKEAVMGNWYVKVAADETGACDYKIYATFTGGDPDANSGDDARGDGAGEIAMKAKAGGNTQMGSGKDEVSFDKRDRTDFWRVDMPDKGKLSVVLKLADKSSKVKAEFFRREPDPDDDGERVKSGFNTDVERGPVWVKVFAPNKGDASKYTLEVEYFPNKFIDGVAVEIDKRSGCAIMVNKGTSSGVRTGVGAEILEGTKVVANGIVEQSFPALTRIKILNSPDCRFTNGQQVRIQDMGY